MNNIAGTVLEDTTVPARGSWSPRIDKGEMLRIVDLEGKQASIFSATTRTTTAIATPRRTR